MAMKKNKRGCELFYMLLSLGGVFWRRYKLLCLTF